MGVYLPLVFDGAANPGPTPSEDLHVFLPLVTNLPRLSCRRFRVADEPGLERHTAHDFAQGQKFLGQFGNDTVTLSKMKAGGSTMWR
ncbi:MAG: hypothetical protein R2873_19930 [Caldilineaceae bacterium]